MKKYLSLLICIVFILIACFSISILSNKKYDVAEIERSLVYIEAIDDDSISSGSGFVYKTKDNKNYIITCYHILNDYESIYVYGLDNEKVSANIVGYDTQSDIAVLEIDDKLNLEEIKIGDSSKLNIGDEIYAVGTPIDYRYFSTFTKGIISYLNRKIKIDNEVYNTIQVDVNINSGNSGGPLVDKNGNVVGVVFIKEFDVDGVGFVLPINDVIDRVNKILN